jgi:hypothetical protein
MSNEYMTPRKRSFASKLIPAFVWKRVLLWLLGNDRAKYAVYLKGIEEHHANPDRPALRIDLDALAPQSPRQTIVSPSGITYVDYEAVRQVRDHGVEVAVTRDGEMTLTLPGHTVVQIHDVSLLLDHSSVRVHQTTSHTMTFVYGGVLSYVVDDAKTMMEAHVKNLRIGVDEPGILKVLACSMQPESPSIQADTISKS